VLVRKSSMRLGRWVRRIGAIVKRHWSDPLSRGGLALLINTGLTGILGFSYWIIATHLFSTYAVGVAGALVAATTLLSGIGQLNLSGMAMRFLPKAAEKSRRLVLVTYVFTASVAGSLAIASLIAVRILASRSSPLRLDTIQSVAFVLAVTATSVFIIQDNVLIGLRRAIWVPAENGAFGLAKIAMLLLLAPIGTAFALFSSWMIPLTLTIPAISAVLFRRFLPPAPRPRRSARLGRDLRSKIIRFAVGDATGGLFTQAWTYLLPVIIAASLGGSANALFYTSFLFSSTIDQVAANYASPLTVEGAHAPDEISSLIRLALRRIFTVIAPIVILLIAISPWLLRAFGNSYVAAAPLLDMLLIACLPKAFSTVYYACCRIQRQTHRSAYMQAAVCIATLSIVVLLAHPFGLRGVGLGVVAVQLSAGFFSWWRLRKISYTQRRGVGQGRHRRGRDGHGRAGAIRLSASGR
jgi:O-antigen/teichoic acid export membrane protein